MKRTVGAVREAQARQREATNYDRAFFVAFLLILPVLCLAQTPTPTGNVENGKKLFVKHDCYWFHGTAGQGGSPGARIGGTGLSPQGWMAFFRSLPERRGS